MKTKRLVLIYNIFFGILFLSIITGIISLIIMKFNLKFISSSLLYFQLITILAFIIGILGIISLTIALVISSMRKGLNNIKNCDDEMFEEIDNYKKCWEENNIYYLEQLKIINLYYKPNGKVDELVKEKKIDRLFKRMDYLILQKNLFDDFSIYFISLLISALASIMCQIVFIKNPIIIIICIFLGVFSFFAVILTKYIKRGKDGSYIYLLNEHEIKCLEKKIESFENKTIVKEGEEVFLYTKRLVINELILLRRKTKIKKIQKEIEEDIKTVEKVELIKKLSPKYYIEKVRIGSKEAYFVYDEIKELKNKNNEEKKILNKDFLMFYNMVVKYNLIKK